MSARTLVGFVGGGIALLLAAAVVGFKVFDNDTIKVTAVGVSMEPTIRSGQSVSAAKVDTGKYRPGRGDIVVFTVPDGWLADQPTQKLIKRVIGLPGEHLVCCEPEGWVSINGDPLSEPYIKSGSPPNGTLFEVTVPDGRLWVMGDNRGATNDSRTVYTRTHDINLATIPTSTIFALVK